MALHVQIMIVYTMGKKYMYNYDLVYLKPTIKVGSHKASCFHLQLIFKEQSEVNYLFLKRKAYSKYLKMQTL